MFLCIFSLKFLKGIDNYERMVHMVEWNDDFDLTLWIQN